MGTLLGQPASVCQMKAAKSVMHPIIEPRFPLLYFDRWNISPAFWTPQVGGADKISAITNLVWKFNKQPGNHVSDVKL